MLALAASILVTGSLLAPVRVNAAEGKEMYRLYNVNTGEHFYTSNESERDDLKKAGWRYEGVGWYSDPAEKYPVYREYNPNARAGAHNFTTCLTEYNNLYKARLG